MNIIAMHSTGLGESMTDVNGNFWHRDIYIYTGDEIPVKLGLAKYFIAKRISMIVSRHL